MHSEEIDQIAAALCAAQAEMNNATLNKTNPHFKSRYADLAAVRAAILPPLNKHGLALTQTPEIIDGRPVLTTLLLHKSGQWISSTLPLPVDAKPQEFGSALTYQRRYGASDIAFVYAEEDDDANVAQAAAREKPRFDNPPQHAVNDNKPVGVPLDPATGRCTPHLIVVSKDERDKRPNWSYLRHFGALFIAAIEQASSIAEIDRWRQLNPALLETDSDPKLHQRIADALTAAHAKLYKDAAPIKTDPPLNAFASDLGKQFGICKTLKAVDAVWRNNETALRALDAASYDKTMELYQQARDRVSATAA